MGLVWIPGLPTVGGPELLIFLVIILLLFGAKRIPELAKGLGSGVREFRQGVKSGGSDDEEKKREELPASSADAEAQDGTRVEEARADEPPAEEPPRSEERVERSEQKS